MDYKLGDGIPPPVILGKWIGAMLKGGGGRLEPSSDGKFNLGQIKVLDLI
jgi:hypothetical protein